MMHAFRTQRKDEGFSLIEVMVAIVILTVGLLSLAQMMIVATNSNSLSGRMTSCSALAKEQLERLKASPFYTNPQALLRNPILAQGGDTMTTVGGYSQLYDPEGLPTAGASMFEVRWQIADVPTALVFSARDRTGTLVAFDVAEFAGGEYAFYQFNFRSRARHVPGASDLLLHQVIVTARGQGKIFLNLGLGIDEGVAHFKRKWGGVPFLAYASCRYEPAPRMSLDAFLQKL